MSEAERIAAGLTKDQLKAIFCGQRTWGCRDSRFNRGMPSWTDVGLPLKRLGLIAFDADPRSSETYFTQLGLSVQRILSETPHAE